MTTKQAKRLQRGDRIKYHEGRGCTRHTYNAIALGNYSSFGIDIAIEVPGKSEPRWYPRTAACGQLSDPMYRV